MRDTLYQFSKRVKERPAAEWSAAIENIKWDDAGKQGAPHVNARRIFDDADEEFLCASASVFFELGFPKDKAALADVAKVAADKMRLKDPETGEPYTCSERFVEGLLKRAAQRGGHDLRQYKSSALDPKRAAAATPDARDSLFDLLQVALDAALKKNPHLVEKWKTWADVPDSLKYNYDEEGKDSNAARRKVIGDFALLGKSHFRRVFEITDGDKIPFHVTNGMTTRADGRFVISPYLVHSAPGTDDPALSEEHVSIGNGTGESRRTFRDDSSKIDVAVTTNGSMTRALFPEWCRHFVAHLPSGRARARTRCFYLSMDTPRAGRSTAWRTSSRTTSMSSACRHTAPYSRSRTTPARTRRSSRFSAIASARGEASTTTRATAR